MRFFWLFPQKKKWRKGNTFYRMEGERK
jgi:hypothetical protein